MHIYIWHLSRKIESLGRRRELELQARSTRGSVVGVTIRVLANTRGSVAKGGCSQLRIGVAITPATHFIIVSRQLSLAKPWGHSRTIIAIKVGFYSGRVELLYLHCFAVVHTVTMVCQASKVDYSPDLVIYFRILLCIVFVCDF